jgi:hypothetical protein
MSKRWLCLTLLGTLACGQRLDLGTQSVPFSSAGRPATDFASAGASDGYVGGGSGGALASTGGSGGYAGWGPLPDTTAHDGAPSIALCAEDPQSPDGLSVDAACAVEATEIYHPTSNTDFVASFVGSWLTCKSPTIFGTDEVGIELTENGAWAKLYRDEPCGLRRGTGFDETGNWKIEYVGDGAASQLYFYIASDGWLGGDATVALPNKLRLTTDTLLTTDYAFYGKPGH